MGISLWQSLSNSADAMARDALEGIDTLDDWKQVRAERHTEFMRSIGLDPLPQRCDLKLTDYGEFKGEGFRARRVGFQVIENCWTSANIYYPDPAPEGPVAAVLYVCGHGPFGCFGYQSHPIMWARRGYVCLIVDTIEQDDNPGEHHGMEKGVLDEWIAMGYQASGGETLNALRALDVLAADPLVDPDRIGVTGLSGGGSCSFWLAIADERVKALSTHCGLSTPRDAITNRHLISHCNCMYYNNLYQRDMSEYGALIAPRAAMFCFADDDVIFRPKETRALVERISKVYRLYGREDLCELVTCPGPHGTHPPFDEATCRWFDLHLAGEERPVVKRGEQEIAEPVMSVYNGQPPSPNFLDILPRLISKRGSVPLPQKPEEWPEIRRKALESLLPFPGDNGDTEIVFSAKWKRGEGGVEDHCGRIGGMDVWLRISTQAATPCKLVLGVANPGEGALDIAGHMSDVPNTEGVAFAGFEPRIGGLSMLNMQRDTINPFAWSINKLLPFAMALTGVTPVTMTIHDIGVVLDYIRGLDAYKDAEIYLYGNRDAGVAALYRGLIDDRIAGVVLERAPASHADASPIPGILRSFDMPQAVGLMAPRKVALVRPKHHGWAWPLRAYERLGCSDKFMDGGSRQAALEMMLA